MISADTNVFVYLFDPRDSSKNETAKTVVAAMRTRQSSVGLQVVGEIQNALRRRLRLPVGLATQQARDVLTQFSTFAYGESAVETALAEAGAERLSYWDALLLAAADAVDAWLVGVPNYEHVFDWPAWNLEPLPAFTQSRDDRPAPVGSAHMFPRALGGYAGPGDQRDGASWPARRVLP